MHADGNAAGGKENVLFNIDTSFFFTDSTKFMIIFQEYKFMQCQIEKWQIKLKYKMCK